jgi:predicted N-acetyltransferase YhbS
MSVFKISESFPEITLPRGFKVQSLEDDNDLNKIDRVLWRGFNHEGEPDGDLSGRKLMQSAPNFRRDLNIVVVSPDGNYVSYCGMWYDSVNKVAYVEPVATDPDNRRMGIGKAAVLEGIRRCKELGAVQVKVVSNKQFYLKMGFETIYTMEAWVKKFD